MEYILFVHVINCIPSIYLFFYYDYCLFLLRQFIFNDYFSLGSDALIPALMCLKIPLQFPHL